MTYDPDELEQARHEADESEYNEAEITEVNEVSAREIFGDESQGDPDREMLYVRCEIDEDTTVAEPFTIPEGDLSLANPQSKLNRFYERYGSYPRKGMTVDLEFDENGFLSIAF